MEIFLTFLIEASLKKRRKSLISISGLSCMKRKPNRYRRIRPTEWQRAVAPSRRRPPVRASPPPARGGLAAASSTRGDELPTEQWVGSASSPSRDRQSSSPAAGRPPKTAAVAAVRGRLRRTESSPQCLSISGSRIVACGAEAFGESCRRTAIHIS